MEVSVARLFPRNMWLTFLLLLLTGRSMGAAPTNVSAIVQVFRDKIQMDYDTMGSIFCFRAGSSLRCNGPWFDPHYYTAFNLYGEIREPGSLSDYCVRDTVYLSPKYRDFRGWSYANVSSVLNQVGTRTAAYATQTCLRNSTCNATYQNDTQRMFDTYLRYANTTFIAAMTAYLKDRPTQVWCPRFVNPGALTLLTSSFNPSNEMFGMHNPVLIPGVLNTTGDDALFQERRAEASSVALLSSAVLETVFLQMVYGATNCCSESQDAAAVISNEIYPGCRKADLLSGGCSNTIPPRAWDLNGAVVPMRERLSHAMDMSSAPWASNETLFERDVLDRRTCDAIPVIEYNIAMYGAARAGVKAMETATEIQGLCMTAAAIAEFAPIILATPVGGLVFAGAVGLGTGWFAVSLAVEMCELSGSCDYIPKGLKDAVHATNAITTGSGIIAELAKKQWLAAMIGAFKQFFGLDLDGILDKGENYQKAALKCCRKNCQGGVCSQARYLCGKNWLDPECSP